MKRLAIKPGNAMLECELPGGESAAGTAQGDGFDGEGGERMDAHGSTSSKSRTTPVSRAETTAGTTSSRLMVMVGSGFMIGSAS